MTDRRRWRSYGDHPLPTPAEALAAPLSAFPSWFIRMECERCGQERYTNEVHLPQWKDARLSEVVLRLSHEGWRRTTEAGGACHQRCRRRPADAADQAAGVMGSRSNYETMAECAQITAIAGTVRKPMSDKDKPRIDSLLDQHRRANERRRQEEGGNISSAFVAVFLALGVMMWACART